MLTKAQHGHEQVRRQMGAVVQSLPVNLKRYRSMLQADPLAPVDFRQEVEVKLSTF